MVDAPEKIYLQWHGDGDPEFETGEVSEGDVTWCRDKIFKHDIPYILQSTADERVREARREVWEKAWLLLHEVRIFAEATGRERNVISSDRRELLKAFEAARAAEGKR